MEITTEFKVNDIVVGKYDADGDGTIRAMEVKTIITETCYAGTQVFYMCRGIQCRTFIDGNPIISHTINKGDARLAWERYREDELIKAPAETIKAFTGAK